MRFCPGSCGPCQFIMSLFQQWTPWRKRSVVSCEDGLACQGGNTSLSLSTSTLKLPFSGLMSKDQHNLKYSVEEYRGKVKKRNVVTVHIRAWSYIKSINQFIICLFVVLQVPGWVFDFCLSCEDTYEDPDIKVNTNRQQGLDVTLVDSRPLVQTVKNDA